MQVIGDMLPTAHYLRTTRITEGLEARMGRAGEVQLQMFQAEMTGTVLLERNLLLYLLLPGEDWKPVASAALSEMFASPLICKHL